MKITHLKTILAALLLSIPCAAQVLQPVNGGTGSTQPLYRTCMIVVGADNASSALGSSDLSQASQCQVPAASTIVQITVNVDNSSSTTAVQVAKQHCATFSGGTCTSVTTTNLMSAALPAPSGGAANVDACAKSSTSATCLDGTTSSGSITISTTSIAAGDYLRLASTSTADGTTKRATVAVVWTVN